MLIHATIAASRANGPGLRAVVWTQGCTLACPGCWNPATHDPYPMRCNRCLRRMFGSTPADGACHCGGLIEAHPNPGIDPAEVAARIIAAAPPEVGGLTVSGGEPLQQAYHLLELFVHVRTARPAWSIGLFSGYSVLELEDGHYQTGAVPPVNIPTARHLWRRIRRYLDFAVLGRYDRTRPPDHRTGPLCSSANQQLHVYPSDRNPYQLSDFLTVYETTIGTGGLITLTGFPVVQNLHKRALTEEQPTT